MKKGVFLMVCCLLLVRMAAAEENVLYPILENDQWGYMNRQGETVIEAVYDRADDFCEDGFAAVGIKENRKIRYGIIDTEGNEVLPMIYTDIEWDNGMYHLRSLNEDGEVKVGFFNTKNGFLQEPVYDAVFPNEQLVEVYIEDCYGFVRGDNGEIVIPVDRLWPPYAVGEQEGYLFLVDGGGCGDNEVTCHLLDENMIEVVFPDGLMPMSCVQEGVLPVQEATPEEVWQNASAGEYLKMGLARADGKLLHAAEFDYVHPAYNGIVCFWDNELCGHMDLAGNIIVPAKYAVVHDEIGCYTFYGDYAMIEEEARYVVIDKQGNEIFTAERYSEKGELRLDVITDKNFCKYYWHNGEQELYGLISFGGEEQAKMLDDVFEAVWEWNGENGLYPAKQNGLYGFIDENGQWVLEPQWDDTDGFENGLAWVEKDCKAAYIDREGNIIWQETRE